MLAATCWYQTTLNSEQKEKAAALVRLVVTGTIGVLTRALSVRSGTRKRWYLIMVSSPLRASH
jgi:hypothetical protein